MKWHKAGLPQDVQSMLTRYIQQLRLSPTSRSSVSDVQLGIHAFICCSFNSQVGSTLP